MSNFMQDAVVAESVAGDVWKAIVIRYASECRVSGDDPKFSKSAFALKSMIQAEKADALLNIESRPALAGETYAERERYTDELKDSLNRAEKNIVKNYLPVIIRAEKDSVPLFDASGKPKPKSALEREYKEAGEDEAEETPQKDPADIAAGLFRTFRAYCAKHSLNPDDYMG